MQVFPQTSNNQTLQINVRTESGAFNVDLMNLVAYFGDSADLDDMDSDVASHLSRER